MSAENAEVVRYLVGACAFFFFAIVVRNTFKSFKATIKVEEQKRAMRSKKQREALGELKKEMVSREKEISSLKSKKQESPQKKGS